MTQVSGLYLHVPFCKHLCNYCDFYKKKLDHRGEQIEGFHRFLDQSLHRHTELMRAQGVTWAPLDSIYLGGGTPSLWGEEGARFFGEVILKNLPVNAPEFTMEVDPGTWTPQMLAAWSKLGLNRISIGTQTLNPEFLKVMDRVHSLDETYALLEYCQQGNWNFSLDFLLGIPHSRSRNRDILTELRSLLAFGPRHVSLYILNARSKYPLVDAIPDDEYVRQEYLQVSEFLRSQGYLHYEVSNFALPGFESRHNLKYWTGQSVAALGPTGAGYFSLSDSEALRYTWKVMSPEIQPEPLGRKELSLEKTYLGLRTSRGWAPAALSAELVALFRTWEDKEFGKFDGEKMVLGPLGFVMLDSLMDDLFRKDLA